MAGDLHLRAYRGIGHATLQRPDKRNALTPAMRTDLTQQLWLWAVDPKVRVLLLDGEGQDFCSGSDMSKAGQQGAAARLALFTALLRFPKPVVAAVQGACIGAGVALVACCDAVLARPDAWFSVPEVRLGFPPGALAPLLLHGLGTRGYRRYVASGERFDVRTAQALGLVHEVCEDDLGTAAQAACRGFLLAAPGAAAAAKAFAGNEALALAVEALVDAEAEVLQSAEAIEGLSAARERRRPFWYPED